MPRDRYVLCDGGSAGCFGQRPEDHVAYLGVKAFDSNDKGANAGRFGEQVLMLTLYNARKNRVVDTIEIGDVKDRINSVQHYAYKTLISVTAGDYDGDGIDEIACTDADMGVQMIEIVKNDSKLTLLKSERYDWTDLVSESVAYEMKKWLLPMQSITVAHLSALLPIL